MSLQSHLLAILKAISCRASSQYAVVGLTKRCHTIASIRLPQSVGATYISHSLHRYAVWQRAVPDHHHIEHLQWPSFSEEHYA
jgi:hypothetical protein